MSIKECAMQIKNEKSWMDNINDPFCFRKDQLIQSSITTHDRRLHYDVCDMTIRGGGKK